MRVFICILAATKHILFLYTMKLNKLFILALASVFAVTACGPKDDPINGEASLKIEGETSYELENTLQSLEIKFTSNRDWETKVTGEDWITVDPAQGEASSKTRSISVTVKSNDSYPRTGSIRISIGTSSKTIKISQKGKEGLAEPDGTKENPFDVASAIAKCKEIGETASTESYYVKGTISSIKQVETAQYGNADFYISNDGGETTFYVFQAMYLGGEKFTSEDQIKVDDEVIVCGPLVNYKGNTPETAGKGAAYIYSLNGVVKEKGGSTGGNFGEPKGTGTEADPFNPAAANAKALENSFNPTTEKDKINALPEYYVEGIVSSIKSIDTGEHGNAELYISEDGTKEAGEFLLYRIYYLNGEKFTADDQVKVGDEVVVKGRLFNAFGNTPEMTQGGQIISINGGTEVGPYLGISVKSKSVAAEAGNFTVNVNANQAWTATADGFLSVSPASGNGDAELTVSYTANTGVARTATVTVKAADGKEVKLTVTQADPNAEPGSELTWTAAEWSGAGTNVATLSKDGYTITVNKQNGSTAPAVRDNGDIRLYAKGTLTIEAPKAMASVTIVLASDAKYRYTTVTADSGEVGAQASGDTEVHWTGSATSVTFTVGDQATLGSDGASKAGQIRFKGLIIE